MDIVKITEFMKALSDVKTPIIVVAFLLALGYAALRIWQTMSANRRARERDETIHRLIKSIDLHMDIMKNNGAFDIDIKRRWDITLDEIKATLNEVKSGFDGKIDKANSLRIIQSKFDEIQLRLAFIVERSLYYNHYTGSEDYVASKVKTEMSEVLVDARSKLELLDLSVAHGLFFTLQPEHGVERFWLCDRIWAKVEFLFKDDKSDSKQRIERARLSIKNTVSDYLTALLQAMAKTDISCRSEVQKQAYERNKALHATHKMERRT